MLESSVLQDQMDAAAIEAFFTECIQRRYLPGDIGHHTRISGPTVVALTAALNLSGLFMQQFIAT